MQQFLIGQTSKPVVGICRNTLFKLHLTALHIQGKLVNFFTFLIKEEILSLNNEDNYNRKKINRLALHD